MPNVPRRMPVILLPGGVLPAALAYPALIDALGDAVDPHSKELEIYATDHVPEGYSLDHEVEGIRRFADDLGFDRFHLIGYSAGGASSLAFCATYPQRLLSLVLNEPASAGREGLSDAEKERWRIFEDVAKLPATEMMPAFMRAQLRDGVPLPPPPDGPPPPWMRTRPAAVAAFIKAFGEYHLDVGRLRSFDKPVLFTLGGKSHPSFYAEIATRLAGIFPDFTLDVFEDRHHFDPPHRVEPKRMAQTLVEFWERAT